MQDTTTYVIDPDDRESLIESYVDKGMSLSDIAKKCPVSRETIRQRLESYGIERRSASDRYDDEETRFWEKVNKQPDCGCWVWTGAKRDNGYGVFWASGELIGSHRYAYKLEYGELPDNQVNHKCDTRCCVKPSHLYSGTQSENVQDAVNRSGLDNYVHTNGQEHPQSKLTQEDVRKIKSMLSDGITQSDVASKFPVSRSTIGAIDRGDRWTHVK